MRRRRLGGSDLELTTVGFGAWAIGGGGWSFGWGPQDDDDSIRAIHRALDLGINWIDTAAVYGLGHSEEVVARAIADRRGKVLVATKCGLRWRGDALFRSLTPASVRAEVEASLRRLGCETIDLYQMHWPVERLAEIEAGWATLAELVSEGKLRAIGVSNFDRAQLDAVAAIHPVASLQPPYSMIDRAVERSGLLAHCAGRRVGVVAYSPMQSGLLTGRFSAERLGGLDAGDWRRDNDCFREPAFSRALELVGRLEPLAADAGRTVSQLAVAWVLRRAEVTAAIVGARRPEQIEETAAAADWELSDELVATIERALEEVAVPQPGSIA